MKRILFLLVCNWLLAVAVTEVQAQGYIGASTYVTGGNSPENFQASRVVNGETYVVGSCMRMSTATTFYTTLGSAINLGSTEANQTDITLTKFDANMNIVWSRFLGGRKAENPIDFEVVDGTIVLVGSTSSIDFPVTNGSTYGGTTAGTINNGIYVKLNANTGVVQFATYLTSPNNSSTNGIAVNGGAVYIFHQFNNSSNARLSKYDLASNAKLYEVVYDGNSTDYFSFASSGKGAKSVVFSGNTIYTTFSTTSTDFPVTDGSTKPAGLSAVYAKINASTGAIEYATHIGGTSGGVTAFANVILAGGKVYLVGSTSQNGMPATDGSAFAGGSSDIFIMCLDQYSNALQFARYFGGSSTDQGTFSDVQNNIVYIGGSTTSPNFPVTSGTSVGGAGSLAYTKLNATTGATISSFIVQGPGQVAPLTNMHIVNGEAYCMGYTSDAAFPTTNGSYLKSIPSTNDYYLLKIGSVTVFVFQDYWGVV